MCVVFQCMHIYEGSLPDVFFSSFRQNATAVSRLQSDPQQRQILSCLETDTTDHQGEGKFSAVFLFTNALSLRISFCISLCISFRISLRISFCISYFFSYFVFLFTNSFSLSLFLCICVFAFLFTKSLSLFVSSM